MLRLPFEVAGLFEAWLREHYPARADRVLNLVREMRGGRLNDPRFGHRMRGAGSLRRHDRVALRSGLRRLGLNRDARAGLDTTRFICDPRAPVQTELFGPTG